VSYPWQVKKEGRFSNILCMLSVFAMNLADLPIVSGFGSPTMFEVCCIFSGSISCLYVMFSLFLL
jgi:hypothetical protein